VSGALGLSVLDLTGRAGLRLGSASGRGQGGPVRLAA
jgi:hypothetical protein